MLLAVQGSGPRLETPDLEAWLDGYFARALPEARLAGAVVVVVRDGQAVLMKGYGVADIASRRAVDPERTRFRVGSISKLFVGEAVMQLVEEGHLDLDRDVATYLDFTLPARSDGPVTLRHLLTHRAGFEDVLKDLIVIDPARAQALAAYLKGHVPRRVHRAGATPAYSNYGVSLAAYIVERVSGLRFEDYVERRIFRPLGMAGSTFVQPLPDRLAADLSSGYLDVLDQPRPFTIYGPAPAGALSTTGADMARFMIARLGDGRITPSFLKYDRNGRRIVGHDGGDPVFRSNLRLLPDERVGLFLSFNTIGQGGGVFKVRTELIEEFIDRYFPLAATEAPATETAREHARIVRGLYESSDRKASFFRVLRVLDQVEVTDNADGTITLSNEHRVNGTRKVWREVQPWRWQEAEGHARIEMTVSEGRVVRIARSGDPTAVLFPAPWYRSSSYLLPLLLGSVLVLVATVLTWPIAGLVHWPGRVVALLDLVFFGGWLVLFQQLGAGRAELFSTELDPALRVLQAIGLVGAAGSIVVAWKTVVEWRRTFSWRARVCNATVALAAAGSAWFGVVTGLLSQSLRY